MQFTKIKRAAGKMEIKWRTDAGENDDLHHELSSFDEPLPEFDTAMAALVPELLRMLELPADYREGVKLTGISLNYEKEDDRMGVVFTMQKSLKAFNAPLIFNTPHLREDDGDGQPSIPFAVIPLLEAAQLEAERYVDGARAQKDLFSDDNQGIAEAVAGLAPKRGSGIESVTISSTIDGSKNSVTLTAEDGDRIRRNIKRMKREKVGSTTSETPAT